MKLFISILSMLLITGAAIAQSTVEPEPTKISRLKFEAASKNLHLLNRKFEFYGRATVLFNSDTIQIQIEKQSNCDATICPAIASVPKVINLNVIKIVHAECEDIYYADNKIADKNSLGSAYEQVILRNKEVNRCPSLVKKEDGSLHYKAIGLINEKQVEAHALFSLKDVRELRRDEK